MRFRASKLVGQRKSLRSLQGYGKSWEPGDQNRVLVPIYWDEETDGYEILAAACWGHKIDLNEFSLKTIFIRSNSQIDEYGKPIGTPDTAYQFSRIARLFLAGEYIAAKREIDENTLMASAVKQAEYSKLEKLYDPQEQDSKKPVMGGLTLYVTTEVAVIKLQDGKPVTDKMDMYTFDLSNAKYDSLNKILKDPKYRPEGKDAKWLEVEFTYPQGQKKIVGKTEPTGLATQFLLSNSYPAEFAKFERDVLSRLPEESEEIEGRNTSFRKRSESEVSEAVSNYIMNKHKLLNLAMEEEDNQEKLVTNCSILKRLDLVKAVQDEELVRKIEEAINEQDLGEVEETEQSMSAPEVSDIAKKNQEAIVEDDVMDAAYEVQV